MNSYHRLWLSMLVLAIVTTSMCGFANEHDVSENANLKLDSHNLEAQAAASFKEMTDAELSGDLSIELHRSLRFEPSQLDFGIWSVGTVRSHTVTLVNLNRNRSVYLSSVSGRTPAFYSSFFEAKMVPPNGNTTFNVVFLPREQGAISTSLHIHTSFGKLKLLVRGEGRECPYRLKPLVGIRAPLNATLMPEIHMYNPHEKALQILEVYSSGGQFQLELPSGDPEAPQGLWEIPPFTTKPVIRIRFQGFAAGNHSAYIRIKIAEPKHNKTSSSSSTSHTEEQVLVIPVEFEILPQYGLYAVNPLLEFGYVSVDAFSKPLRHNLSLRHSKHQLEITDLEFKSLTYIVGVTAQGNNVIVLDPNELLDPVVRLNEKLQLVLKDTTAASYTYHNVELIIRADIFKGILHYDTNKTIFITHKSYQSPSTSTSTSNKQQEVTATTTTNDERLITVRNDFQIPMAIYNVTTNHNDTTKLSLQIKPFETGMVLQPGLSFDLFMASRLYKLHEQNEDLKDLANYKTAIYVYTNITNFEIPLVISSARLFVTTQTLSIWRSNISVYTKELNFGSIPLREMSHKGFIIFQNRNSIPIKLNNWDIQRGVYVHISLFFLGCAKAATINKTNDYVVDLEQPNFKFGSYLEEGDIAVYQAMLQPYKADENMTYFDISTQYENITISLKYSTALGRLEVDQEKLHFANCFPGKLCSSELSIRSTFKHPIHIKYIKFTDPGLRFEDKNAQGSKIAPQSVTTVGRIFFKPSALCGSRCYIQQNTDEVTVFPSTPANTLHMTVFDKIELRRRTELYRHFKYYFQNIDFTLTTKEMQHFQLNLMIELQWPQLVQGHQPLAITEVNKPYIHELKISNPSDNPILIDYMVANRVLAVQTHISLPLEVVGATPSCYLTDKEVFSLVNPSPEQPVLIPGLSSVTVPIKFVSDTAGTFCSLLNIRNNLTLFEGVWISAKTVQSQFRLGNRKPGSTTPLLFEISEQHLASACPAKDERFMNNDKKLETLPVQPQVMSRRVFTARNSGELPINIEGFWIGDQPCKGYGFQVMDCSGFELKANSSKKIEIAFQSDFTVTRISRPLTLKTNLSYEVRYLLVAQLPSKGLEQCMVLLPRPPWEEKIRNAAIVMLIITFILVLVAVHIDYGNIIYHQSVLYEARDKGTVHPTFNLRNIAMRSTQNNNENSTAAASAASAALTETNNKNNKLKLLSTDKCDNSASASGTATMSLKKRNNVIKNSKTLNGDVTRNTMSLAEMVSWTFGKKTSKKPLVINKNDKSLEPTTNVTSPAAIAVNETKSIKSKTMEKYIIAKMDGDMKKSQTSKKSKATEKPQNSKVQDKATTVEEVKFSKDDQQEKEIKKGKNSPKTQTKSSSTSTETNTTHSAKEPTTNAKETTSSNLANLETVTQISDKNVHQTPPAKDLTNVRKVGKTPGRERRKQAAQNTSPVTSDVTSSSSSTSSSCSSHHNAATMTGKRYPHKPKNKATNSLKFSYQANSNANSNSTFPTSTSSTSSSSANHVMKPETSMSTATPVDILTPWDCGNQVTFSDVLQKTQQQQQQQLTMTNSTDLTNQTSSLFAHKPHTQANMTMENSEISAALTPKKTTSTNSATDLGPIGSRKSPSSTPVWEPLNSAITMQLPRPLNTTTTTSSSSSSSYYPMHTNFGYQDLATMQTQISPTHHQLHHHQSDFVDITAQLLELKKAEEELRRQWQRQLLEQQHLQHQQEQQQQFLNSSLALNNNWSNLSSPLWTPILGNSSSSANTTNNTTSAFAQPQTQNSTWSLNPSSSSSSSSPSGLVRPPPGLEQNFNTHNSMTTPMQNHRTSPTSNSASVASSLVPSSSSFNNNTIATSSSSNGLTQTTDNDNMPMFNLFGGLSSIWNDNWKQSTSNQQQQPPQQNQQ